MPFFRGNNIYCKGKNADGICGGKTEEVTMVKILIGFIMDGKAGGVDKYILDFYEKIHGKYAQVDLLTNNYTEELAERLKIKGSRLLVCPRAINTWGQYKTLKNFVSQNGYNIVYFNYSTSIGWSALKGARDGGADRVVLHSHNNGFCHNNTLIEKIYKIVHYISRPIIRKYATDYLSCSDEAANWMFGTKAVKSGKIKYIKNEVDSNSYQPSEEKRIAFRSQYGLQDNFVIGNVGGMLKAKNQAFLIKLMPQLKKYIPNVKLMLVGDGENRKKLEGLSKALNISNDVIFTGYLNTKDGIMNSFDVFCLPSYIEGYPYVSVEAQRLFIPCIFSEHITKQIVHTNACAYISVKKPSLWIERIIKYKNTNQSVRLFENYSDKEFITFFEFITGVLKEMLGE